METVATSQYYYTSPTLYRVDTYGFKYWIDDGRTTYVIYTLDESFELVVLVKALSTSPQRINVLGCWSFGIGLENAEDWFRMAVALTWLHDHA